MALKDTGQTLTSLLAAIQADLEKALEGNMAAAQRVRTGTIRFEKAAKIYRKESVQAAKSGEMKKVKKSARKKGPAKKAAPAASKKAAAPKKAAPKKKAPAKKKAAPKKTASKPAAKKRMTAKIPKKKGSSKRK